MPRRARGRSASQEDLTHLLDLPAEALIAVIAFLSIREKLDVRHTCSTLRKAVASAVHSLLARDAELPPRAWAVYEAAIGVVVRPPPYPGFYGDYSRVDQDVQCILRCIRRLPSRLQELHLVQAYPANVDWRHIFTWSQQLVAAIAQASFSCKLKRLVCDCALTTLHASALLERLTSLTSLSLQVRHTAAAAGSSTGQDVTTDSASSSGGDSCQWHPPLPSGLTSLQLITGRLSTPIVIASIGSATALTDLHLYGPISIADADVISSLPSLRKVRAACLPLQHLGPLQELRELEVDCDCTAQQWAVLSQLPSLRQLEVQNLAIGQTSLPAAAAAEGAAAEEAATAGSRRHGGSWSSSIASQLTSLSCKELSIVQQEQQEPQSHSQQGTDTSLQQQQAQGVLTAAMPLLQRLHLQWPGPAHALASALQQHQGLRQLAAVMVAHEPGQAHTWPRGRALLASLPLLEDVKILQLTCDDVDGLLHDVAGCAALQELVLAFNTWEQHSKEGRRATAAGFGALAAGACARRLWRVVYGGSGGRLPLEALAPLLAGAPGMAALQEVRASVECGAGAGQAALAGAGAASAEAAGAAAAAGGGQQEGVPDVAQQVAVLTARLQLLPGVAVAELRPAGQGGAGSSAAGLAGAAAVVRHVELRVVGSRALFHLCVA